MGLYATLGVDTATTLPTSFIAGSTAKSAYAQITAAAPFTSSRVIVRIESTPTVGNENTGLFDLATGAAGAETVIIPDMLYSMCPSEDVQSQYDFPLRIASGDRIAVRGGSGASNTFRVSVQLLAQVDQGGCPTSGSVATYGAVLAPGTGIDSFHGTQVDPGLVANTKGAWSVLTSSTTAVHEWITLAVGRPSNDGADDYGHWLVDIATGAPGAEVVVASDLPFDQVNSGVFVVGGPITYSPLGPLPIAVPLGTALSVRAQCNLTTAVGFPSGTTLRLFDAVLYGVNP